MNRTIFIDIEPAAKGPNPPIIEFAAIATESGTYRVLDSIDCLIQFDIEKADPEMLGVGKFGPTRWEQYAIPELDAATKLAHFLKRHATIQQRSKKSGKPYRIAQLAAHNANFDVTRIENWFERLDLFLPAMRRGLCTEQLARWFIDIRQDLAPPYDYRLGTLAYYFSLPTVPDHSALADTRAAVELARTITSYINPAITKAA